MYVLSNFKNKDFVEMKEILFQLITFSTLFVLTASKQVPGNFETITLLINYNNSSFELIC